MADTVLTKPVEFESEVKKTAGPPPRKSSKAFNSYQIAQTQFDKGS